MRGRAFYLEQVLRRNLRWFAPAVLVLGGLAWRTLWLWRQTPSEFYSQGEANNVARSLALNHTVADALGPGTGATAHLTPAMPWIASLIYSLLGVESGASLWVLSGLAVLVCTGAGLIYMLAASDIGIPRWGRLLFLGMFLLLPVYAKTETVEFRFWEGGLASLLGAIALLVIVRSDKDGKLSTGRMSFAAVVAALLFFISPPLGLAAYAASFLLLALHGNGRTFAKAAIISVAAAAAVFGPWTYRNWVTFHRFMPLRSNFGLEFALGNYPQALTAGDPSVIRKARFTAVHPVAQSDPASFLQRRGGEVAYSDQLAKSTWAWVRQNPAAFVQLSFRHVREFYFPPKWFWPTQSRATIIKQLAIWGSSFFGLVGAVMAFGVWRDRSRYVALMAVVPSAVYALVQPNLRYHYIVHLPLLMLTVLVVCRAVQWVGRRSRGVDRRATLIVPE